MTSEPVQPQLLSGHRESASRVWWIAGLISVVILLVYAGTADVPLLLDDHLTILENHSIRKPFALREVFTPASQVPTAGRPLANFSFAASYALSGVQPWGHHLVNLAVHLLSALALFGVLRRTFLLPILQKCFGKRALWLAAVIALLWSTHPILVQTVTYVSQRTEALMALFYLLTVYCFIRGLERRSVFWHWLSILSCLLGAMCKEVIVTAPIVVLLYDRSFVAETFRAAVARRRWFYSGLASTWILLAWLLVDVKSRGVGFETGVSPYSYALTQCKAVGLYIQLSVWPSPLVFDRGERVLDHLGETGVFPLVWAGLIVTSIWAVRRSWRWAFLPVCFIVLLVPTSSVVPIAGAPIAENRVYLPSALIVTLAVIVVWGGLGFRLARIISFALLGIAACLTVRRNMDFRSGLALWTDTLTKVPGNHRAHEHLALFLSEEPNRRDETIAHYAAAQRLNPHVAAPHHRLALFLASFPDRFDEAIEHYAKALQLEPDNAKTHYNFAVLLATHSDRISEAIEHYKFSVRLNPDFAEAHKNLAMLLSVVPDQARNALLHYASVLRLEPSDAKTHYNLALLLASLPGRQTEALGHYETALRLNPKLVEAHINLANLLSTIPDGRSAAETHYEAALRLNPDSAQAHNNYGALIADAPGRRAEAIGHYEAALRAEPNYVEAHNNLANLLGDRPECRAEAVAHYEICLRLNPRHVGAHNNLALLLAHFPERSEEALSHFRAAAQLAPDDARVHNNLARHLELLGRREESLAHYRRALQIDAGSTAAREGMVRLQSYP